MRQLSKDITAAFGSIYIRELDEAVKERDNGGFWLDIYKRIR